jgi:EAL domain-containing protein (putative c-di-GMP-specific phosphodiesterase class I)
MSSATLSDRPRSVWRLEGPLSTGGPGIFFTVRHSPTVIGRRPGTHLTLSETSVSGRHARLTREGGRLLVEDLGSTNGTFVNGERVTAARRLDHDDIVQFGSVDFRVSARTDPKTHPPLDTRLVSHVTTSGSVARRKLRQMIDRDLVTSTFQSIVRIEDGAVVAYEALGRGAHPDLDASPARLLQLAEEGEMAAELSRLFRHRAIEAMAASGITGYKLFVNAHPAEVARGDLDRTLHPEGTKNLAHRLVLELHEGSILELDRANTLRGAMAALGVEIAYDDFGEGQTRLAELGSCPPDYIKFARPLIAGLHRAGWERRHVLQTMVSMALDLGCVPLAEGVETAAELKCCLELGFVLAQGYHFDRPRPIDEVARCRTRARRGT